MRVSDEWLARWADDAVGDWGHALRELIVARKVVGAMRDTAAFLYSDERREIESRYTAALREYDAACGLVCAALQDAVKPRKPTCLEALEQEVRDPVSTYHDGVVRKVDLLRMIQRARRASEG